MKNLILIYALTISVSCIAFNASASENKTIKSSSKSLSTTDSESAIVFSEEDKTLSKQWGLSKSDWLKYKNIMRGPRGVWSPGLDPITALGVSETDPQERKRYAELWVEIESRRAELEMAFEVERSHAAKRIHKNQLAFNNTAWIQDWQNKQKRINKHILLFIDAKCKKQCKAMFDELYASVGDNSRLDIFFQSGAESNDIGQWASYMKIPPEVVKSRSVTLNFDDGKFQQYKLTGAKLPQVRVIDLQTGKTETTYQ